MPRICFLNPFGTDAYDGLIADTLTPALRPDTRVQIRHLDGCPRNIDFYVPKHLVETEIIKSALQAQEDGFDAFVIGCCYDPALTPARELVDIPVVGPLEASAAHTRMFGHRFAVLTDHYKAVPEIEDLLRMYGMSQNCRKVEALGWFVDDMVENPAAVARDTSARVRQIMAESGAETVVLGCTIVSACYELAQQGQTVRDADPVINPNVMAMKVAELYADLRAAGQYRMGRGGYYGQHAAHDPDEAAEVRHALTHSPSESRAPV
jgi:allantoin racemase